MTAGRKFLFSLLVATVGLALIAFVARTFSRHDRPRPSLSSIEGQTQAAIALPESRLVKDHGKPAGAIAVEEAAQTVAVPAQSSASETPVNPHESSSFLLELRNKMGSPLQGTVFSSTPQDATEIRNEFVDRVRQIETETAPSSRSADDWTRDVQRRVGCGENTEHAQIETLRTAADDLDRMAQQLERSDLYEAADRLRDTAKDLRLSARAMALPEAAIHAPVSDPTVRVRLPSP